MLLFLKYTYILTLRYKIGLHYCRAFLCSRHQRIIPSFSKTKKNIYVSLRSINRFIFCSATVRTLMESALVYTVVCALSIVDYL